MQQGLFAPKYPQGFIYSEEFITLQEERELIEHIKNVDLNPVVMRGQASKRRIKQFGLDYEFGSNALSDTDPIPDYVLKLRRKAGELADIDEELFKEALITEYSTGSAMGWHVDASPFDVVVGISVLGNCVMRLRHKDRHKDVIAVPMPPRSAYVLDGPARSEWEHSIMPTKELRYSITFRTLKF